MKKLRLDADAVTVESFAPADESAQARELFATRPQVCDPLTLPPHCG